ncbi:hypothetical protein QFC22_003538 [Naganishia vaughanmartiniae]|uniref:Uncharacterized protein n=1 Tax=Naganishia vaughanmartiniae TaxID=1424756 RepID=A0ACC2X554_9TREE|nr:hypothetical protein QFC22_003538 [Naganishia vaughanmartiniae]
MASPIINTRQPHHPPKSSIHTALHSKARRQAAQAPETVQSIRESMIRRVNVIKEGDSVMLRLPSDVIKSVLVTASGVTSLGKYGSFPTSELIGKHYDIAYEIVSPTMSTNLDVVEAAILLDEDTPMTEGPASDAKVQAGKKGKKGGKKEKVKAMAGNEAADATGNILIPRRPARMEELEETDATNELIDDISGQEAESNLLTAEEIHALRAEGVDGAEIIRRQEERHNRFKLKTEFSKEKWRKRKEKKYSMAVTPLAPTPNNLIDYYNLRTPATILSLRRDTMSQLLNLSNIRPGGRYLVVDDAGGLLIGSILERLGGHGRIYVLTDSDSPPGWPVLEAMNFERKVLDRCLGWLNWSLASEEYTAVDGVDAGDDEDDEVPVGETEAEKEKREKKLQAKARRKAKQVEDLERTRDELHCGGWDGRLTPYLGGSAPIVIYSQYQPILAQTLNGMRSRPEYLAPTLTESFMRRYQVLPGRTHPTMSTSGTGGFLLHATRVIPSAENNVNRTAARRLNRSNAKAKKAAAEQTTSTEATPEVTSEIGKRSRAEAESSTLPASAHPAKKARLDSTVHVQETHTSLSDASTRRGDHATDNVETSRKSTLMDVVDDDAGVGSRSWSEVVTDAMLVTSELGLEQAVDAVSGDDEVNIE